jgi:hypothetical protein
MDNTLSIKITNTNPEAKPWTAFGFNEGAQNQSGVLVSIAQSSLQQATRESANIPFVIDEIKIKSFDPTNLDNAIIIHYKDSTGKLFNAQFTPSEYLDPTQHIQNLVVVQRPNIEISGNIALQGTINGNSSITILLDITKKKFISSFINSAISIFTASHIKISQKLPAGTRIILNH